MQLDLSTKFATRRIMGSQNWWFGGPKEPCYTESNSSNGRVQNPNYIHSVPRTSPNVCFYRHENDEGNVYISFFIIYNIYTYLVPEKSSESVNQ